MVRKLSKDVKNRVWEQSALFKKGNYKRRKSRLRMTNHDRNVSKP